MQVRILLFAFYMITFIIFEIDEAGVLTGESGHKTGLLYRGYRPGWFSEMAYARG